jgi:hypothetical protein
VQAGACYIYDYHHRLHRDGRSRSEEAGPCG